MTRDLTRDLKRPIAFAGLLVGVLDGLYAMIVTWWFGGSPWRMFQGIAGGLLGREAARAGGVPTVLLGILCHFTIATCVSAVYIVASRNSRCWSPIPSSMAPMYGVGVWAFMRWVVISLSALGRPGPLTTASGLVSGLVAHTLLWHPRRAHRPRRALNRAGRRAAEIAGNACAPAREPFSRNIATAVTACLLCFRAQPHSCAVHAITSRRSCLWLAVRLAARRARWSRGCSVARRAGAGVLARRRAGGRRAPSSPIMLVVCRAAGREVAAARRRGARGRALDAGRSATRAAWAPGSSASPG